MPGTIRVVIGPNGYGKTTYLNDTSKKLANAGESILMVPSEIKLLDEVKDTVDTSQTMEFLLSEILETPAFVEKRKALYAEADAAIASSLPEMNQMLEEVLSLNGSKRTKDFIALIRREQSRTLFLSDKTMSRRRWAAGRGCICF